MSSLIAIAAFEFRSRLKLISTWVYFLIFFAVALLWMAAAGGLFKDAAISFGSGKVAVNSPFALMQTVGVLGMLGDGPAAEHSRNAAERAFDQFQA